MVAAVKISVSKTVTDRLFIYGGELMPAVAFVVEQPSDKFPDAMEVRVSGQMGMAALDLEAIRALAAFIKTHFPDQMP